MSAEATEHVGPSLSGASICGPAPVVQAKGRQLIKQGQRLRQNLPGGGGYGAPEERVRKDIEADLAAGFVTDDSARNDYK